MAAGPSRGYAERMNLYRVAELAGLAGAVELEGGDICAVSRTRDAVRPLLAAGWSMAALMGAFSVAASFDAPVRFDVAQRRAYKPVDLDGHDAVALAQSYVASGDEIGALQRLGGVTRHPDGVPAWRFEKTGDDAYLVVYRGPGGFPAYAFEVDLAEEEVTPSPEASDALARLRVDEDKAFASLVATRD